MCLLLSISKEREREREIIIRKKCNELGDRTGRGKRRKTGRRGENRKTDRRTDRHLCVVLAAAASSLL